MPASATPTLSTAQIVQRIEALKKRWPEAMARRDRLAALKEAADAQLAELRAEAAAAFGTDDLNALRAMLQEQEAQREKIVVEGEATIAQFESELSEIERRIGADRG